MKNLIIILLFFISSAPHINDLNSNEIFVRTLVDDGILIIETNLVSCSYEEIDLNLEEAYLISDIKLYKFELGVSQVSHTKEIDKITFNSNSCRTYVLGINQTTNEIYRLRGYEKNEIMNLLYDLKAQNGGSYKKTLKRLESSDWVDFFCVY